MPLRRPVAWPLALSLAAHGALALWCWRETPPAPRASAAPTRPAMVWLRLTPAQASAAPPVAAARIPSIAAVKKRPAPKQQPAPAATPAPVAMVDVPTSAEPASPPAAPPAPVAGVAFGPPRWSLPFGAGGGSAFGGARRAANTAASPIPAAPIQAAIDPARPVREQVMQALEAQLAQWSAPSDPAPAQCRVFAVPVPGATDEPECDSRALADALAGRLAALRDALATLRPLGSETTRGTQGAAFVIAFADGRYRLQMASR
jgi:hypothetical protein